MSANAAKRCMRPTSDIGASATEKHGARWRRRSSKPVGGGDPTPGGFDSFLLRQALQSADVIQKNTPCPSLIPSKLRNGSSVDMNSRGVLHEPGSAVVFRMKIPPS